MIIKLTSGELAELVKYKNGTFGESGFEQFMAGICAKIDETSGEIDVDRDDRESIANYSRSGHKRVLDRIFKRPVEVAINQFMK